MRLDSAFASLGSPSPQWKGYMAALMTVVIWAGFILVSRLGGRSGLTGWDIVALRLAVASLVLLPFSLKLPAAHWRDVRLWVLAALGCAGFLILVYAGFKTAPAAHGGILLPGMQPFLVTALTWLLMGVRPSKPRLWGLLPIALGVASMAAPVIQQAHSSGVSTLPGDALLLGGSVCWAAYSVLVRKWVFDGWTLTKMVTLMSAAVYLPVYALALPKGLDTVPTSMLLLQGLYQGLGPAIVAMVLFLQSVKLLGAERTGAMVALVPVLAGLAAVPLLGEHLTTPLMAGLALVSWGAYLSARAR